MNTLKEEVETRIERKDKLFILKYKKQILPIEDKPEQTLHQTLDYYENYNDWISMTMNLMLEYIDKPVHMLGDPWTIYIVTFEDLDVSDVEISNPQVN